MIAVLLCGHSLGDVVRDFGPMLALIGVGLTLLVNGSREERRRRRDVHARALEVVAQYYEMPFLIKRRRYDEPSAERARLTERFADIQAELASCEALIRADRDWAVRSTYAALVKDLRHYAGEQASEAWKAPPIQLDEQIGMGSVVDTLKPIMTSREACENAMARSTTARHRRAATWRPSSGRLSRPWDGIR
ncbi:MAG TPA: hypothetical protein VGM91_20235 [Conexibacter sp.]